MEYWEYKAIRIDYKLNDNMEAIQDIFNKLGADGWELVIVTYEHLNTAYFKRKLNI